MQNRVLLIAPLFFGYYREIMAELKKAGYEVDFFCDAPSNSNISKALGRINKSLIEGNTSAYFESQVMPGIQRKNYSFVLVVGGMTFSFTPEMMRRLRESQPGATFILYQWDSENNLPYAKGIHKFFDRIFSFDRFDCESKERYQFLPLFYTSTYEQIGEGKTGAFKYDCCYVGTAHPKKFKCINDMVVALGNTLPNKFVYHYMPSSLKYFYHKLLSSEYKGAKMTDFQWKKLSAEELALIIKKSRIVLDSPQAGQIGLTMRCIECIGAKRKLITTNEDIVNYDFYREENILVFDGEIDWQSRFFLSDYVELPRETYEKYSLHSWLKTMME